MIPVVPDDWTTYSRWDVKYVAFHLDFLNGFQVFIEVTVVRHSDAWRHTNESTNITNANPNYGIIGHLLPVSWIYRGYETDDPFVLLIIAIKLRWVLFLIVHEVFGS